MFFDFLSGLEPSLCLYGLCHGAVRIFVTAGPRHGAEKMI